MQSCSRFLRILMLASLGMVLLLGGCGGSAEHAQPAPTSGPSASDPTMPGAPPMTGVASTLRLTVWGTYNYDLKWATYEYPKNTYSVAASLSQITAATVFNEVANAHPAAMNLTVKLVEETATRKEFTVTYREETADDSISYDLFWTYESR